MADPFPICFLNGEYTPLRDARISPLDRGFLFADSVYEVLAVFDGRPYRFQEHFDRLDRSLREIRIEASQSHDDWRKLVDELIERNQAHNCYVYLQVTRGMEFGRNHAFPQRSTPSVFAMCSPLPVLTDDIRARGLRAITVEDFRWGRCDIKSTMLLANVLVKQSANESGANEAIFTSNGEVLEGASTSVFVISKGVIATPPNSQRILPGTTREAALELAQGVFPTQVRTIHTSELTSADEVWIAAATRDVLPITQIDGTTIADGKPGPIWRKMLELFAADRRRPDASHTSD